MRAGPGVKIVVGRPVLPQEPSFAQANGRAQTVPVLRAKKGQRGVAPASGAVKGPLPQADVLPTRAVVAQGAGERGVAYAVGPAA